MTNRNAFIGMDIERLFKNSIQHHPVVLEKLKDNFKIEGEFAKAFSTGTDSGKSDVILRFTDGTSLSANIKAFKIGFNQITRSRIATFCKTLGIESLQSLFEEAVVRVAGRKGAFIQEQDRQRVLDVLEPIAERIMRFSLARMENPELLILFDRTAGSMHLYDMHELLDNLNYEISFSSRGIIKIGKFFTIQRKGGNGVHSLKIENVPRSSGK